MIWMFLLAAALVAIVAAVIATLIARNQSLAQELERQKDAVGGTRDLIATTDERLRDTFQSLAREALSENRTVFLDLAAPIAETLQRVNLRLEEVERARLDAYARLTEKITT